MDWFMLVIGALTSSGALSYAYELLQRLQPWLAAPGKWWKRLLLLLVSAGIVLLGGAMHQELPTSLGAWTPEMVQAVVLFALTQLWHFVRKLTEGSKAPSA